MNNACDIKYTKKEVILFGMVYKPVSHAWLIGQFRFNCPDKVLSKLIKHFHYDYTGQECMRIAFNTKLDEMPLYVDGHPEVVTEMISLIAKWRLQIGR